MEEKIRLNRFIARSGICSRRKADDYIKKGLVRVNGEIIKEMGIKISPCKDKVEVEGRPISPQLGKAHFIYVAIYKPIKVITSLQDPRGRTTILDILPTNLRGKGLVPIGRLDYYSEGLLLLSNDGEFVHRMTHPRFHLKKIYEVHVQGIIKKEQLSSIKNGMYLPDIRKKLAPIEIEIKNSIGPHRHILFFTLIQGINRQIRRICKKFRWKILKLKRIQHGPISLGDLSPGSIRPLSRIELLQCKRELGIKN